MVGKLMEMRFRTANVERVIVAQTKELDNGNHICGDRRGEGTTRKIV